MVAVVAVDPAVAVLAAASAVGLVVLSEVVVVAAVVVVPRVPSDCLLYTSDAADELDGV